MSHVTTVVGVQHVTGDMKRVFADVVFSGNYATGGEAFLPAEFGLQGPLVWADLPALTTGSLNPVAPVYNAAGSVSVLLYETSAAAAGVSGGQQEKTNAEAYGTCSMRMSVMAPS